MPILPVRPAIESPPVEQQQPAIAKPNAEIHVIKQLPSNFMAYDVKQIEIRSLTLGEMKYLQSEGLTKRNLVDLYKNVILNYDVNKLTWSDFSYIASHVAMFTTESAYWQFPMICKKCQAPITIKLSSDHFVLFEDTSDLKGYPLTVTIGGQELDFGFLSVERCLKIIDNVYEVEKHLQSLYALSAMVINKDIDEAFEILKTSTKYEDESLLIRIAELLYHDTLPVEWKCEHCGHTDKYKVDVEVSTISPFRDNAESLDSRIKFGKRSK